MKVSLPKTDLHRALKAVIPFVPTRSAHALYRKVLVESKDDRLELTAQGDHSAKFSVPANVSTEGKAIIDPTVFERIAHQTEMGPVEIKTTRTTLQITTSVGNFKLQYEAPDIFPQWLNDSVSCDVVVPRVDFALALKRTLLASDEHSQRFTLGCTRIELQDGALSVACCDGRRIAHHKIPLRDGTLTLPLIASSAWKQLLRAMPDDCSDVTLTFSDLALHFATGDLSTRLGATSGRWPEWRQVLTAAETNGATRVAVRAGELLRAVRLASIANSQDGAVRILLTHDGGTAACSGNGESAVTYPLELIEGEGGEIEVAPQFLVEWLGTFTQDDVVSIHIAKPTDAIYLCSGGSEYLIAPMSRE